MKHTLITLMVLLCFGAFSRSVPNSSPPKGPDARIKIVGASFNKGLTKGEIPCTNEIYLKVRVEMVRGYCAVPIKAYHYVDGSLKDSIKLHSNSTLQEEDYFFNGKGSPYYDINSIPDPLSLLLKSTEYNPVVFPDAMSSKTLRWIDSTGQYHKKLYYIIVKAPFEASPPSGSIKQNKYVFKINDQIIQLDMLGSKHLKVNDTDKSNNIDTKTFYQRCNTQEVFAKSYPETFLEKEIEIIEEPEKIGNKIINFLYPTNESLKPGTKLTINLFTEYNGRPLNLNKVQWKIFDLQGNSYLIIARRVTGFVNQSLIFDLPTSIRSGPYVCQIFYEGKMEAELFVIHK
ncbi:hypothetical protein [Ekhidna sp.]